jgi:hypothetical protein
MAEYDDLTPRRTSCSASRAGPNLKKITVCALTAVAIGYFLLDGLQASGSRSQGAGAAMMM